MMKQRCGHLRMVEFGEFACQITGTSMLEEDCAASDDYLCLPRLALRYRMGLLDVSRFGPYAAQTLMEVAETIHESAAAQEPHTVCSAERWDDSREQNLPSDIPEPAAPRTQESAAPRTAQRKWGKVRADRAETTAADEACRAYRREVYRRGRREEFAKLAGRNHA